MIQSIIKAARVIDGQGDKPLTDQEIVIQDGGIQDIKPWGDESIASRLREATVFDVGDATLLPGFIDAHLHLVFDAAKGPELDPDDGQQFILLRAAGNAQAALQAGVTTVCDCGAPNEIIFPLRDAIERGAIQGPRIVASGAAITTEGGHGAEHGIGRITSGVGEVRQAVAEQVEAGADFLKVMATAGGGGDPDHSQYNLAELRAIKEEADRLGVRVAAHAHGTTGIQSCVEVGIQRIEHCSLMTPQGSVFDPEIADEIVRKGIYVCPTNVIDYRQVQRRGGSEEGLAPRTQLNVTWRRLYEHGVKLVASSDAGVKDIQCDDYALIQELMVTELGLSPMQAIMASTKVAAEALGLADEIGTLKVGKRADLVVVSGNPLDDITTLRHMRLVMRGGEVICNRLN
jgi:imidazolonepropionase-like amidohydrolase